MPRADFQSQVLMRQQSPAVLSPVSGRLVLSATLLAGALAGCGPTSFIITPVPAKQELTETVVLRENVWAVKKVALIDVDGVLTNKRPSSLLGVPGENPLATFTEKLDRAAKDDQVRAVVLRINSPGGGVTASDLMYTELDAFRRRTGKPVVAAMLDLGTSGAYYLACGADRVFAQPTTVTGGIGVVMLAPEFAGTMAKIGARVNVIKSGEMKDAGSPFREMNAQDRAVFQGLIDKMYARFLDVVSKSRAGVPAERLRSLADGRVYFGPEAKELGLVDEVGSLHDAIGAAKQLAGLADKPVKVVEYGRPLFHRPNIYAYGEPPAAQLSLLSVTLPDWVTHPAPQFLYLWAPGW